MPSLTLIVPLVLHTPNRDRGAHWATRHRLTKVWELALWAALLQCPGWRAWLLEGRPPERRRLTITRRHRTARSFCKDSDNRMFAGKGIRDALKRLHLLTDDSDRWLESAVVDVAHPDKRADTIICLERIP